MSRYDPMAFDTPISYSLTRARSEDPDTSKQAAKTAATLKSQLTRALLSQTIRKHKGHWSELPKFANEPSYVEGWTAKELASHLDLELPDVYRRLAETGGIKKHESLRRQGCAVYVAA